MAALADSRTAPPPAPSTPYWLRPAGDGAFSASRIGKLEHNFQDHPLMALPALERLAKDLRSTRQCRFITPGSTHAAPFHHTADDPDGRDIAEVFRRIEEPGSWIALYNVETHPDYRRFVDEVAACFRPLVEREQSGIFNVGGFIFISAPPAVTPFHIDRENNFWLQVRGRKRMHVWDHTDRVAVGAREVDMFVVWGALEDVRLRDGVAERGHAFDVGPGEGVYFPSTSPHMTSTETGWARPGDGVSVSIGVVFYTDQTRRAAYVHAWNLQLRKFGFAPTPPGESAWRDAVKYPLGRALVFAQARFRGFKPQVGF